MVTFGDDLVLAEGGQHSTEASRRCVSRIHIITMFVASHDVARNQAGAWLQISVNFYRRVV